MSNVSGGRAWRQIAVFDLDGTITRRDTLMPYLRGWRKRHPGRGRLREMVIAVWNYVRRGRDRGRLKSELIRMLMAGATATDVEHWTREFVAGLGDDMICAGAVATIESHRRAGDLLVLLSASVDLYVPQIAARLGFDETICTGVAWDDGRLVGSLTTANRRAGEKRRCIEALRTRFPGLTISAYANSTSDLEHLRAVERPLLVNAGPCARRAAQRAGIPVADWRNKSVSAPV